MTALVGGLVAAALVVSGSCQTTGQQPDLFAAVNELRAEHGLALIEWDDNAASVATGWATHLADSGEWAHDMEPWANGLDRHWDGFGETIARLGDAHPDAITLWLESPTHRDVLLHPRWDAGGIGVARRGDTEWIVLDLVDDYR